MKALEERILKLSPILNEVIIKRSKMTSMMSISKLQDEIHERHIYTLLKTNGVQSYIAKNALDLGNVRIPDGQWIFVVTVDNPFDVVMMCQSDINKILLEPSFSGRVGIGHTSLTRQSITHSSDNIARSYVKERLKIASRLHRNAHHYAKDVYLAGEIFFVNGVMNKWNNDSGHYRVSAEISRMNIPSHLSHTLPLHLFTPLG